MTAGDHVAAWRPQLAGVAEVFRTVTSDGFHKRVIYLEEAVLPAQGVGRAVDQPLIADSSLRSQVSRLDHALVHNDALEADDRLAVVVERLGWHLAGSAEGASLVDPSGTACSVRDLIDADPVGAPTLLELAERLGLSASHLVRAFTSEFRIPPHRYTIGRRIDVARRRLLEGEPAAQAAVAAGFHDQAHLTRHFRRMLGTTPARYQRSGGTSGMARHQEVD